MKKYIKPEIKFFDFAVETPIMTEAGNASGLATAAPMIEASPTSIILGNYPAATEGVQSYYQADAKNWTWTTPQP